MPYSDRELTADRIDARIANLAAARERWPIAFNDAVTPLVIDIHLAVQAGLGLSDQATADLMRWWCTNPRYRAALVPGAPRIGLDGQVCGHVGDRAQATDDTIKSHTTIPVGHDISSSVTGVTHEGAQRSRVDAAASTTCCVSGRSRDG